MKNRLFTAVATAVLGAGLVAAPASAAPPAPGTDPSLIGYSFKPGVLKGGTGYPEGIAFSRFDGVLAVPPTPGRHPVAVIVHGSYANCVWAGKGALVTNEANTMPWPEACGTQQQVFQGGDMSVGKDYIRHPAGFAYLAKHLAEQGIATVAIDVAAKDRDWTGEADPTAVQTMLVKEHLRLLRDLDQGKEHGINGAGALKGRLDLSKLALVGHSNGAGWATQQWEKGTFPELKAVVALQPAMNHHQAATSSATAPIMFVAGTCDEQSSLQGVQKDAAHAAKSAPKAPAVLTTVKRSTHAGLVGGMGSHRVGLVTPVNTPECADAKLLPKETMRSSAALLAGDFLRQAFDGKTSFALSTADPSLVESRALNSAAKATVTKTAKLPGAVAPRSVTFQDIPEQFIPALPAGTKINPSNRGGREGRPDMSR